MRKPALLLAYVVALAAFAGVAWHFRGKETASEKAVAARADGNLFTAEMLQRMAANGQDVPEHLYPEDSAIADMTVAGQETTRWRSDYAIFSEILGDPSIVLYQVSDAPPFAA